MAFECKILADSIGSTSRKRLTTFCVTYPRAIHSEILTHRDLSRNSASSRAIPTEKLIQRVLDDPWVPTYIGKNQKGMQAIEDLTPEQKAAAVQEWLNARDVAVARARELVGLCVHKQVVNRLIEPWMWITVIISATELTNFYGLRLHKDAEPHFQHIARMMFQAQKESTPKVMEAGQWHLPLVDMDEADMNTLNNYAKTMPDTFIVEPKVAVRIMCSVARCARVSYLTHDGRRSIEDDLALFHKMVVAQPLHASPAEHAAMCLGRSERIGNFVGWKQYRKFLPNEYIGEEPR